MAHRVQLALYDLSRGMAKAMSAAILGKQIEGDLCWQTSSSLIESGGIERKGRQVGRQRYLFFDLDFEKRKGACRILEQAPRLLLFCTAVRERGGGRAWEGKRVQAPVRYKLVAQSS